MVGVAMKVWLTWKRRMRSCSRACDAVRPDKAAVRAAALLQAAWRSLCGRGGSGPPSQSHGKLPCSCQKADSSAASRCSTASCAVPASCTTGAHARPATSWLQREASRPASWAAACSAAEPGRAALHAKQAAILTHRTCTGGGLAAAAGRRGGAGSAGGRCSRWGRPAAACTAGPGRAAGPLLRRRAGPRPGQADGAAADAAAGGGTKLPHRRAGPAPGAWYPAHPARRLCGTALRLAAWPRWAGPRKAKGRGLCV